MRTPNIGGILRSPGKVFYGWWIALAGLLQNYYTSGTFWYGFGAFFNPIVNEFGWNYATTSVAFSIQQSESGAFAPFVGFFIDRFGPRRVMLVGTFLTGLGFILLSLINSLWTFYGAIAILALGMSLGSYIVITTTVSNWFIRLRGRAMAVFTTGAGLAGTLVPVLVLLINVFGWRTALVFVGCGTWLIGVPIALVLRRRPEDYGYHPDGKELPQEPAPHQTAERSLRRRLLQRSSAPEVDFSVGQALHTPSFWFLSLSLTAASFAMSGVSVHLIPVQISLGFSRETAALTIMLLTLLSLVGRWTGGLLSDLIDERYILAVGYTLQAAGVLVLSMTSAYWHLMLFLLLYSPGFGATIPTRLVIQARYFGRRSFGTLIGILTAISTVFSIMSPIFIGWTYDVHQSYRLGLTVLAIACFAAALIILITRRPKLPTSPETTAF